MSGAWLGVRGCAAGLGTWLASGRRWLDRRGGGGREWPGIREVEFSGQDREGRAGTGADAPTSVGSPFLGGEGVRTGGGRGGVQPRECSILPWSAQ